jgi:zinc protease
MKRNSLSRASLRALPLVLGVGLALAASVFAQGDGGEQHGSELSKVVRLNRAPVNKEILKVTLPKPAVSKLPNGLTVLVIERHKLPTVEFSLWIKTGALADPKNQPGLASFTADMLREGTRTRSSSELSNEIDGLGASLNASAQFGASYSTVTASGLAPDSDRILELMSDVVVNPTFPQDELDKYKQRQLAALQEQRSSPSFLGREKFQQVLYQDFPAAVVSATSESVKAVTADDLRHFHDEYYVPGNAILGVIGDVTPDDVTALIRKHFGDWQNHAVNQPALPPLPSPAAAKVYFIDRPDSVQTDITAGAFAVPLNNPDYIPLFVMNRVLGGGPSARLFLNLREAHGYTYGAYSSVQHADVYRGALIATTQVHNAVTDGSMTQLMYEFKRIRDEKVNADELGEAERSIVANFALSLEEPAQLLTRALQVEYFGLPADYWDRYPAEIASVTPDQVQQMAQKYVDLDHLQIVCVGDGKQAGNDQKQPIRDVLAKYGTIEVYDTNGKRLN